MVQQEGKPTQEYYRKMRSILIVGFYLALNKMWHGWDYKGVSSQSSYGPHQLILAGSRTASGPEQP